MNTMHKLVWLGLTCWALGACAKTTSSGGSSETHFLALCNASCAEGLSCLCGVCTESCDSDDACKELNGQASCRTPAEGCGTHSVCDVECSDDDDCGSLGSSHECDDGHCRAPARDMMMSAGAAGTAGEGGTGESGTSGDSGVAGSGGGMGGEPDAGGTGGAGGQSVDDAGTTMSCAAQLIHYVGTCEPAPRYHWTGSQCWGHTGCSCTGPDCDRGYGSMEECEAAHEGCEQAQPCAGFLGPACPDGWTCLTLPGAACGVLDDGGYCQPVPDGCDDVYEPVCSCSGETHSNTCEALRAGAAELTAFYACGAGSCAPECTGLPPDDGVAEACANNADPTSCQDFATGGFPSGCRWVTPASEPCVAP